MCLTVRSHEFSKEKKLKRLTKSAFLSFDLSGPNNPSRILYANESAASSSTYATTAYAPPSYASPIYAPPTYSPSTYAPTYAAEEANNATVNASKTRYARTLS